MKQNCIILDGGIAKFQQLNKENITLNILISTTVKSEHSPTGIEVIHLLVMALLLNQL